MTTQLLCRSWAPRLPAPRASKTVWRTTAACKPPASCVRVMAMLCASSITISSDPDAPPLPEQGALPVIIVDGVVIATGGKISIPAISRQLEQVGYSDEE